VIKKPQPRNGLGSRWPAAPQRRDQQPSVSSVSLLKTGKLKCELVKRVEFQRELRKLHGQYGRAHS
jgi:hypothetical protein